MYQIWVSSELEYYDVWIYLSHDFKRRFNSMKRLGELITFPGIAISDFLFHIPKEERKNNSEEPMKILLLIQRMKNPGQSEKSILFIDLKKRSNVFAWMNCRKTLSLFWRGILSSNSRLHIHPVIVFILLYCYFKYNCLDAAEAPCFNNLFNNHDNNCHSFYQHILNF
ncbi:MAG: hypothetical protein CM1200mP30_10050 [Pseudomonadota bacterium]|nr:MAG: hypothetical protein CM1200mP30_10050 [Pseudomonadota bacterium]